MFFELLQYQFIQRALIAGVVLGILYAVLGVYVILRKMAFWGDGIAHASLAGIAFALYAGMYPLVWAIVVAVIFAVGVFYLERKTTLSNDTLIGVLFTSFMALGIVVMSFIKGYQPELVSFLFGNILTVTWNDVIVMSIVSALILFFVVYHSKKFALLTFDKESAYLAGIPVERYDLAFYVILAIAVVLGVKILGIILVSALLVMPASIAQLVSGSFKDLKQMSLFVALGIVLGGLIVSLSFDIPTGPTIILVGAVVFMAVTIFSLRKK